MKRFFTKVLVTEIEGRRNAEIIEHQYIVDYRALHGDKPRGNL
jgi:hypothetical protein